MCEWKVYVLLMFLSRSLALGRDTVASDLGVNQMKRLVEMLTLKECEDLLSDLSQPEQDILQRIDELSPENNELGLNGRAKRDATSVEDEETECRAALTDWLQKNGEKTNYYRLSRALQHIGRTDIALELGKNVHQDKMLNLKRYVEDYRKLAQSRNAPFEDADKRKAVRQRIRTKKEKNLSWRDMDLFVEGSPESRYSSSSLEMARPFAYGLLLGFGGTLIAWFFLFFFFYISHRRPQDEI